MTERPSLLQLNHGDFLFGEGVCVAAGVGEDGSDGVSVSSFCQLRGYFCFPGPKRAYSCWQQDNVRSESTVLNVP